VALVYAGGVLAGSTISLPLVWLFVLSLLMAVSALIFAKIRFVLLWPVLFLAGWTNLSSHTELLSPDDLRSLVGTNASITTIRGTLIDSPIERVFTNNGKESRRTLARIQVTALQTNSKWRRAIGQVTVSTRGALPSEFFSGREIEVCGVIAPPKGPSAEGLFDYSAYLRQIGIYYQINAESAEDWRVVDPGSGAKTPPFTDRFRSWAQKTLARGLPREDESLRLSWAMALGWTTALTGEVSEPFTKTGTMHIFAISGLHIALIAGILVAVLRVLRISRGFCGWLVIPLIWFYTGATGWQASAIRSTLMMTVIIIGWTLRRPSDLLNSLAAAAFIILLWDPQQLFQAGFQL
jgi:predicted membrane metal-binding protein